MIARLAYFRTAEEGATAAEMALVVLAALILIFGSVEFALAFWSMNQLQLAVEETGRWLMVNNSATPAQAEARMQYYLPGSSTTGCTSPSAGQLCVNATQSSGTMTLTASYGFNVIGIGGHFTLASQATVPLD